MLTESEFEKIQAGYYPNDVARSLSLNARCYTEPEFLAIEKDAIFYRTWQWVCHVEKVREAGAYYVADVLGRSIALVRGGDGQLRAFYNVCKHRAHHLLTGEGSTNQITCPYHAWTYHLDGRLNTARKTDHLVDFNKDSICLSKVQVEEFCGFVYVNLDGTVAPLAEQSGELKNEIMQFAPDVNQLTFAHRETFELRRRCAEFAPYTYVSNVSGQPSLSLPLQMSSTGLPIGIHFTAKYADEALLFRLAAQLETVQPWADLRPSLV